MAGKNRDTSDLMIYNNTDQWIFQVVCAQEILKVFASG